MSEEQDHESLRLLAAFHYVFAGLTALSGLLGLGLLVPGLFMLYGPEAQQDPDLQILAWVLIAVALSFCTLCLAHAGVLWYTGRCFAQRRHRILIWAIAISNLLLVPVGTALGVYTIMVMARPSVKKGVFRQS